MIFALSVFLVSTSSFASSITCQNQSERWEEDSLVLDLATMSGDYFDNDSWIPLICSPSRNAINCHEQGDDNSLRTHIESDGTAVAIYSEEQKVNFKCPLPAPLSQ